MSFFVDISILLRRRKKFLKVGLILVKIPEALPFAQSPSQLNHFFCSSAATSVISEEACLEPPDKKDILFNIFYECLPGNDYKCIDDHIQGLACQMKHKGTMCKLKFKNSFIKLIKCDFL